MVKTYYDKDADLNALDRKVTAVIGYGSQGHAQAQNLRDSGCDVVVGLRRGSKSWDIAENDGFKVTDVSEASRNADIVQVLIPDEVQKSVYEAEIKPNLSEGDAMAFSHGFNIHYSQIVPPSNIDVFMVAPKSPGHLVRRMYEEGVGVPGLLAVYQDYTNNAASLGLAYAKGIGCTRAGVIETSFREETESDLFGEQAVLCGGVSHLIKAAYETLVEAGYRPEIAYFECLHELKLIIDLIYEGGIGGMRYSVSDTATYGDLTRGPRIINEETREEMRKILREVQSGEFAKEWILENQANRPVYRALEAREKEHQIEKVGAELRQMMPWLKK